jgi:hypothetical protein
MAAVQLDWMDRICSAEQAKQPSRCHYVFLTAFTREGILRDKAMGEGPTTKPLPLRGCACGWGEEPCRAVEKTPAGQPGRWGGGGTKLTRHRQARSLANKPCVPGSERQKKLARSCCDCDPCKAIDNAGAATKSAHRILESIRTTHDTI